MKDGTCLGSLSSPGASTTADLLGSGLREGVTRPDHLDDNDAVKCRVYSGESGWSRFNDRNRRLTCECCALAPAHPPAASGNILGGDDPDRSSCPAGEGVTPCGRSSAADAQQSELQTESTDAIFICC